MPTTCFSTSWAKIFPSGQQDFSLPRKRAQSASISRRSTRSVSEFAPACCARPFTPRDRLLRPPKNAVSQRACHVPPRRIGTCAHEANCLVASFASRHRARLRACSSKISRRIIFQVAGGGRGPVPGSTRLSSLPTAKLQLLIAELAVGSAEAVYLFCSSTVFSYQGWCSARETRVLRAAPPGLSSGACLGGGGSFTERT